MIIRDIRRAGTNVFVRAFGTYAELAELGASTPMHQEDRLAELDLTVYPCTLERLDGCSHLTDGQKEYVHKLYDAAVVAKEALHV